MVEQDAAEFDWHAAEAALMWQIDLGVEDWLLDAPLNRYDLPETVKLNLPQAAAPVAAIARSTPAEAARRAPALPPPEPPPRVDPVALARKLAAQAGEIEALREAMAGFEACELRRGARNLVFASGFAGAKVMVLGEVPSVEEDREGRPFAGLSGVLFDRMFAAIGLSRESATAEAGVYAAPIMPWRAPGGRELEAGEMAMMQPFVERHIELAAPEVIVVMGNAPLQALTGQRGIMKLRGIWGEALGRPVLPMLHPEHLMRNPSAKREAWADLLKLQKRVRG